MPSEDVPALAVLEEMQRLLDAPFAELVNSPEKRAHAEELTREAATTPAEAW